MRIQRTVTVEQPAPRVYAFLADFTTTQQWDPGTVRTVRESGDGGPGTRYRNVSRFLGRETELVYVAEELRPSELIRLRGENATVQARDTMRLTALPGGRTRVDYRADFAFRGAARLFAPLLYPALRRLGARAERQLRDTLSRL
jgi:uncharacterized protein YndB with AHSA1/START domain